MDNWMNDWIVENVEEALGFKLQDWQKEYIFNDNSQLMMCGVRSGRTTAHMLKIILSKGDPIRLDKPGTIEFLCGRRNEQKYYDWFEREFSDIYYKLSHTKLKRILRPVKFKKARAV